jgi:hypothetical protein
MRAQTPPQKEEATAEILLPLTPIPLEERLSMKNK